MLFIKPHLHVGATKLSHGTNVFHEALQQGKDFYHVVNPSGSDYDLEYVRNNDLVPDVVREPNSLAIERVKPIIPALEAE